MHTTTALATLTLLTSTALAQTPSLTIIEPPADQAATRSTVLSRDGSTVGGFALPSGRGFTWSRPGGYRDFTEANGYNGFYTPFALSPTGDVVVGGKFSTTEQARAFRRVGATSVEDLGSPWNASFTQGSKSILGMWTNQTGTRVIASVQRRIGSGAPQISPFVWTQEANSWQPLIPSQQSLSDYVDVNDASDDGTVVVGQVNEGSIFGATRGFVHRADTGYSLLTVPTSNSIGWTAQAVNASGNIIVGDHGTAFRIGNAVVWRDGVPTLLPNLANYTIATALDVTDDGNMVIGTALSLTQPDTTFVWTLAGGTRSLTAYLADYAVSLPGEYTILSIHLSGDGNTIAGYYQPTLNGENVGESRAFVFTIPAPSSILLLSAGTLALTRRRR
jgi:hypothetical protein